MVTGSDHFAFDSDFLENYLSKLRNFYIFENLFHSSTCPQKFFFKFWYDLSYFISLFCSSLYRILENKSRKDDSEQEKIR